MIDKTGGNGDKEDELNSKKTSDKISDFRKYDRIEDIYNFAKQNKLDTIAYILLIIGLILLFLSPLVGELLIGIVAGLYFTREIVSTIQGASQYIDTEGLVRTLILVGILVAFFISAPGIFIGAAIAAGIKKLFLHDT